MISAKGVAAFSPKEPLGPFSFERREPKEHDVVIEIKYCGICHSDIHTVRNEWGAVNMSDYFNLLKMDGALVVVGIPDKPLSVHPYSLVSMRRSYAGSLIGGIKETQEMLDFCGRYNITPEIELIGPEQINNAYERVVKSDVRYRFVIDTSKI
jgi:uncharacterized zinc-type alcohol dehydrogenase-like protein